MSSAAVEPMKAYATGRGVQVKGVRVQDVADITVHTAAEGSAEVTGILVGPTGTEEPLKFKKVDASTYETSYKPAEPGSYTVNLQYGMRHITKSPFKVAIGLPKESKVRAYGSGLVGGIVDQPAEFIVETNGETGDLRFAVEGPSQANIQCSDNGDGSADITYKPTSLGEHAVHVLWDDEDIPNSPFMAMIAPALAQGNSDMVDASGPGLKKNGVIQGKRAVFTVDTRKAGNAPLKVYGQDLNGKPINVQTKDSKDGTFRCQYIPEKPLKHTVFITFGGVNVPKSPFKVYVKQPAMPEKVKVYGPGIEKAISCSEKTHFFVDCTEAGPGDVAICLTDDKGVDMPFDADGEGLFRIEYEPQSFGAYTVNVIFADQEIPTSPYYVKIEPSIEVSDVKVVVLEKGTVDRPVVTAYGPGLSHGIATEPCSFTIDTKNNGSGGLWLAVEGPGKKKTEIACQDNDDGTGTVTYLPTEPGQYNIVVKYDDEHITGSPFTSCITGKVNKEMSQGSVEMYKIHELNADITSPSGKSKTCILEKLPNGNFGMTFTPMETGIQLINVYKDGHHIVNSPFKIRVTKK